MPSLLFSADPKLNVDVVRVLDNRQLLRYLLKQIFVN